MIDVAIGIGLPIIIIIFCMSYYYPSVSFTHLHYSVFRPEFSTYNSWGYWVYSRVPRYLAHIHYYRSPASPLGAHYWRLRLSEHTCLLQTSFWDERAIIKLSKSQLKSIHKAHLLFCLRPSRWYPHHCDLSGLQNEGTRPFPRPGIRASPLLWDHPGSRRRLACQYDVRVKHWIESLDLRLLRIPLLCRLRPYSGIVHQIPSDTSICRPNFHDDNRDPTEGWRVCYFFFSVLQSDKSILLFKLTFRSTAHELSVITANSELVITTWKQFGHS